MWPLYHLVLFDTLLPCVACGTLSALLLRHFAQSAAWALLCIPLFSLFPLFGGWAQVPLPPPHACRCFLHPVSRVDITVARNKCHGLAG